MKIFGYLEIDGRRYHAEDVLYALLQQGIMVEVLENQDYSLRIDNKLIDPDPSLKSQSEDSCPFLNDINDIKESLFALKSQVSEGNPNKEYSNRTSTNYNGSSGSQNSNQNKREGLNSLMQRLYSSDETNNKQYKSSKILKQASNRQNPSNGSQKSNIPYKYLSKPSSCAFCGSKISETTKFCYNCGNEVVKPSKLVDM